MAFEQYWNEAHKKYSKDKPIYDNWLDKYSDILSNCKTPILDLGCGGGNDSLYLIERGYNVIATDYSTCALESVKKNIPQAKTQLVDISKVLPFKDNTFDIIIADLSLHYFDDKTTKQVMLEIKRILNKDGHLFARVNSIDDLNYGAVGGEKIEDNYYYVDGYNKRFFSIDDAIRYFSIIGKVEASKNKMNRYSKEKKIIEINVVKTC